MSNMEIIKRSLPFKVRASDSSTDTNIGHVEGIVVPLGQISTVTDVDEWGYRTTYDEMFATDVEIVSNYGKLFYNHDKNIGTQSVEITSIDEQPVIYGRGDITLGSTGGADTYALAKSGAVSGISIAFTDEGSEIIPKESRGNDVLRDLVIRKKVSIAEFSLVDFPAYSGAGVKSVRNDPSALNNREDNRMPVVSEETANKLNDNLSALLERSKDASKERVETRSLNESIATVVRKLDKANLDEKHRNSAIERIERSESDDIDNIINEELEKQTEIEKAVAEALKQKSLQVESNDKVDVANTQESKEVKDEEEDVVQRQINEYNKKREDAYNALLKR